MTPPENPRFGLIAAPFTAFHADGSLNLPAIDAQVAAFVAAGLRGVFVCGTTGEGASMTGGERMAVAQRWVEAAGRDLEVIVHVGHPSLPAACELAAHAQIIGASSVAGIGPYFFKPRVPELVGFCGQVAAAAPRLPFFYYHIPVLTGVDVAMADFLLAARGRIPTLAGVKFTHENLFDYGRCLDLGANEFGGKLEVFFGRDEILLAALALGARAAVGSTYNFLGPLFHRLTAAFARGDLDAARAEQARVRAFVALLGPLGGLPPQKLLMRWKTGVDCGPCRLPLRNLSPAEEEAFRADLERIGFFGW